MSSLADLRVIRDLLNDGRMVTLAGLLAVSAAIHERSAENKRRLVAQLRALDEFTSPVTHEDYRPQ